MSIAALRELRNIFPDAHIALHTRAWAEGIFRDATFLDEIITFEEGKTNFRTMLAEAKRLRKHKYDIALLMPNSFRSAAMTKLAGIPSRIGYATEGRSVLLTKAIKVPEWKSKRHEAYYYLNLVSEAARYLEFSTIETTEPSTALDISEERKLTAHQILNGIGIDRTKPIVAMGPGSTNSLAKRWPSKNFAILNDRLQNDLSAAVVLFGSANESSVGEEVAAFSVNKPLTLIGKTSLDEASALLSIVDVFVSNDMGLAHLASAVGTKTVVMFGPTDPETTRPFSDNAIVVNDPVECSPCMLRECPIDHRCMIRVSPDRIYNLIAEMLT